MAKNKVTKKITTPTGTLVGFISVLEPSTRFNPEGVYRAELLLTAAQGKAIADEILAVRTEQYKTYGGGSAVQDLTRCVPYTTINAETGEVVPDAEGRYILKTTAKAFIENGIAQNKIGVFDAACKPVKNIKIGEGTKAKLSISLEGYTVARKTGVSVKLLGMQIIDLVEYGSGSASACGFTAEEGFTADDAELFTEAEAVAPVEDETEEDF
jgi:hypothetical protein